MRTGEQELKSLEYQVDELIKVCQRLQDENKTLRARQAHLMSEKSGLIEKNEMAKTRVEAMIIRLRSMEQTV